MTPIRIFIGGVSPEHDLPTAVLEYSIKRHASCETEIRRLSDCPIEVPVPQSKKNRPVTHFSFQRFLIPEWCEFEGRAIYLDSDQVVLADIAELWKTPFPRDANVLNTGGWQSAVMLIDCETARWRIADMVADLNADRMTYKKMMNLQGPRFRMDGAVNPHWNDMDRFSDQTKLLHYTGLATQPWISAKHPHGDIWEKMLVDGIAHGHIERDLVIDAMRQEFARPSLAYLVGEHPSRTDGAFEPPYIAMLRARRA